MMSVARWHGALVGALFSSALGIYVGNFVFLLVGIVPLAYVVYGYVAGLGPPALEVSRALSADHTDPGEPVTVELTVRNVGDRPIPDLRLVDGVPDDLTVVDGAPAACVALRADETATVEYDVLPPRGTHEFGKVALRGRSLAGTVVGTTTHSPEGAQTVTCDTLLEEFPLREQTMPFPGQHLTDVGGEGIEFHSLREYRRGDSMSRIDWRRLAKTGQLATVNYRLERAASVVFVVDARPTTTYQPPQGGPSTTDYAIYAASQGFLTLAADGHSVGVTTLSPSSQDDWVPPGRGERTRAAASDLFEDLQDTDTADPASSRPPARPVAPDGGTDDEETAQVDGAALGVDLVERLPDDAQVVLCTALADETPITVVETLLANRHDVTVLSPNVSDPAPGTPTTPGQAVTGLARRTRLTELERLGVPAADWRPETSLQVTLATMLNAHDGRWNA